MLLWQQNNLKLRNKYRIIAHIIGCLLCVHLAVLIAVLFITGKRKPLALTLSRNMRDVPVFFYQTTSVAKNTVASKKSQASRPVSPKPALKQQAKKATPVSTNKKVVSPSAKPVKKTVSKKNIVAPKKPPVKEQTIKKEEKPVEQHVDSTVQQEKISQQERNIIMMQHCLAEQVASHFKVPPGLAKDVSCEFTITVDAQGKISSYTMSKSSGSLLFDMAVEQALAHVYQLPLWAAGQQFSLTFN